MTDEDLDWLPQLYEEQGPTLHRLVVLLGAEEQSGRIVRTALLGLHRRGNRLIDPVERVEFLQEQAVHLAHSVRPPEAKLELPEVDDPRQEEILSTLSEMPPRSAEILVVSHYLSVFGPELAGIMRLSVRACNQRLEAALEQLRKGVGAPTPGSVPGVIESLSQEMTAALRSAARTVQAPGTETLSNELRELGQRRGSTLGTRGVALLLLLSAALGIGLAAAARYSDRGTHVTAPTAEPTITTVGTRSVPAQVREVPLYYLGRQDGKLYQERRDLSATGNLLRTGLDNLFDLVPLDPDYESAWNAGQVIDLELSGDTLVVNLSADAYADLQSALRAQAAINQVVYTASEIVGLPDLKVRFLADGATPPAPFVSERGFQRDGLKPMSALWINQPSNGEQVPAGSIALAGSVQPNQGEPEVTITDIDSGAVVSTIKAQTSTAPNAEGWRVWTVTVTLEAGNYDVTAKVAYGTPATIRSENKTLKVSD